ncbi:MAG: ring-opening amidohydrolase, partial [Acidimicrobiales bacterium]
MSAPRLTGTDLHPLADVQVCHMNAPDDISDLRKLFGERIVDPADIVALVVKCHGTGLPDDKTRVVAERSLRAYIETTLGRPAPQISVCASGGCPPPISPHVTVLTQRWVARTPDGWAASSGQVMGNGLVIGRATAATLAPEQIGRRDQVDATAAAVAEAMADAGVTASAVRMVLVKGQALRPEDQGPATVGSDLGMGSDGAVSWANDAANLGVAIALSEVDPDEVTPERIHRDATLRSRAAAVSSAGDKQTGEIVVLARRPDTLSQVDIGCGMAMYLGDAGGLHDAMRDAGLPASGRRVVQVLAKLSAPADGLLLGNRPSERGDSPTHTAVKAAGAAVITSVSGLDTIFVSGGERTF